MKKWAQLVQELSSAEKPADKLVELENRLNTGGDGTAELAKAISQFGSIKSFLQQMRELTTKS